MNPDQYQELQLFVKDTVGQSESRIMAHVSGLEQKLHDLEQRVNGVQAHVDGQVNGLRGEIERVRFSIDQLNSHLRS